MSCSFDGRGIDINSIKCLNSYDLAMIKQVINDNGFKLMTYWGDLAGSEYAEDGKWIGLFTRKMLFESC